LFLVRGGEVRKRFGGIDGPLLERRPSRGLSHVTSVDDNVFQLLPKL
jgi:hypothetical protein